MQTVPYFCTRRVRVAKKMIKVDNVNKQSYLQLYCILFLTAILFSVRCTNTNPNHFAPEEVLRSVSWISVKTGLTDSTKEPGAYTEKQYIDKLNKAGFVVSWERVDNAAYYELRISKGIITNKNWNDTKHMARVTNNDSSVITITIDRIQPSVSGRNCTGCQACVAVCPRHAITIYKGKAVIDVDSCIGCDRCYEACTYNAVSDMNETKFYYFAVRAFTGDDVPGENITCTDYAYKSRFTNLAYKNPAIGLKWCGFCGAGCYILDPSVGNDIDIGACPVDAIYYDPNPDHLGNRNMIYIDQSKCIACGLCVEQCPVNGGHWSVRREVISSEAF